MRKIYSGLLPGILSSTKNRNWFIAIFILIVGMAFVQCIRTTHDLNWAHDPDFDRDIAFAQGFLDGHFGKDPSYAGEYIWYNPMLFSIESGAARILSLPIHIVVARAGPYLNILGPVAFFIMLAVLFNTKLALVSSLSYLFLSTGNILGWGAATYSPWLYPVCFAQFIFYINIIFCYKAFSTQKNMWFIALGLGSGISFLAHTAPTIMIILITGILQFENAIRAWRRQEYRLLKNYLVQFILVSISFLMAGFPLLYYVIGKYHLNVVNRWVFLYTEGIYILRWNYFLEMIKENISVSFMVGLVGFVWVYRNIKHMLAGKIFLYWLIAAVFMYAYSSLVASIDHRFNIHLPGTVPSFHYFFYLKALQSVFFGFGLLYIVESVFMPIADFFATRTKMPKISVDIFVISIVILCSVLYYPLYKQRGDFVALRALALQKQADKDKVEVYEFIVNNISDDKVILCEAEASLFPIMPTARKMVSTAFTFSNPYLDFDKRERDRMEMLRFIKDGNPLSAIKLFDRYQVSFVLLSNKMIPGTSLDRSSKPLLRNGSYSLFKWGL